MFNHYDFLTILTKHKKHLPRFCRSLFFNHSFLFVCFLLFFFVSFVSFFFFFTIFVFFFIHLIELTEQMDILNYTMICCFYFILP